MARRRHGTASAVAIPLELVWTTLAVEAETDLVDLIYRVVCRVEAVTLLAEWRMTAVFK